MSLFDRLLEQHLKPAKPPSDPAPQRRELTDAEVEEALAPRSPPPKPEPVNLAGPLVPVGSCKAINPETGRQCALLAGHTKLHRHGSTEFRVAAMPGQKNFTRRDALDTAATSRNTPNPIGEL